jgi:hypothetical protein
MKAMGQSCAFVDRRNMVPSAPIPAVGGVDPLPTFVASPTDGRADQTMVIRAGLLVMLTTGSHQLVRSSRGLGGGAGPLILIVGAAFCLIRGQPRGDRGGGRSFFGRFRLTAVAY